jgi:hypothetical protein
MDAKKLKLIVRGDKKPTFGTDPNEPWSVRAGITESERGELHAYLKSRGINPEFVSKDTKISHAKSSEFHKWRRDHQFDDPINFVSTTVADRMKQQRAQTEEVATEAWDNSATKIKKSLRAGTYGAKPTALERFRAAAATRAKKHDDIEKEMKARHAAGKEDMKGAIDRLEKQLNKEEVVTEMDKTQTPPGRDGNSVYDPEAHASKKAYNVKPVTSVKAKKDILKLLNKSFNKEEVEQIDELNYDTVKSLYKKRRDDFHGAEVGKKKKGKEVSAKNVSRSISRLSGFKPTQNQPQKEEFNESGIDEAAGISKEKETKFHKKLDKLVHNTFGKRKDEMKMKEEVDITEKNDSHTHAAHYEDPKTGEWTGMNLLIAKDDDDAIRQANEKCKEGCRLTKVERHITVKEDVQHKVGDSVTVNSKFFGKQKGKVTKIDNQSIHVQRNDKKTSEKYPHDAVVKEDVEQIDELKKSTVFSWLKQQPVVPEKKPGMSRKDHNKKIKTSSKSWNRALDRLSGYKPTSEDVFQDSQAATQTAFDMGTQADDREPTYSKRKEMSKSARIIKSLYKKHKMVKEELYDHEKEDKSVATYGKKPKTEKQEVYGDDDAQAAMILKGGTTLTGQTRDTLEIDPVMRKPVRPDNKISNKKTDK